MSLLRETGSAGEVLGPSSATLRDLKSEKKAVLYELQARTAKEALRKLSLLQEKPALAKLSTYGSSDGVDLVVTRLKIYDAVIPELTPAADGDYGDLVARLRSQRDRLVKLMREELVLEMRKAASQNAVLRDSGDFIDYRAEGAQLRVERFWPWKGESESPLDNFVFVRNYVRASWAAIRAKQYAQQDALEQREARLGRLGDVLEFRDAQISSPSTTDNSVMEDYSDPDDNRPNVFGGFFNSVASGVNYVASAIVGADGGDAQDDDWDDSPEEDAAAMRAVAQEVKANPSVARSAIDFDAIRRRRRMVADEDDEGPVEEFVDDLVGKPPLAGAVDPVADAIEKRKQADKATENARRAKIRAERQRARAAAANDDGGFLGIDDLLSSLESAVTNVGNPDQPPPLPPKKKVTFAEPVTATLPSGEKVCVKPMRVLRAKAKRLGLKNYSKMRKAELCALLTRSGASVLTRSPSSTKSAGGGRARAMGPQTQGQFRASQTRAAKKQYKGRKISASDARKARAHWLKNTRPEDRDADYGTIGPFARSLKEYKSDKFASLDFPGKAW